MDGYMNFKFHCSYSCSKFITTPTFDLESAKSSAYFHQVWMHDRNLVTFWSNFSDLLAVTVTSDLFSQNYTITSSHMANSLLFSTIPKWQHNETFNITGCCIVIAMPSPDNHKTSQHTAALTLNRSARWQKVPATTEPSGSTLLCRCSFSSLIASSHEKFARLPFSTAPPIFADTNLHNTNTCN